MFDLTNPRDMPKIDKGRVAAVKYEINQEHWCEIWVVPGYLSDPEDPTSFVQVICPCSGKDATYFKIEDGYNPVAPGAALSRCDICDAWGSLPGACSEDGCDGTRYPYSGFSRLFGSTINGMLYSECLALFNAFLATEEVPSPVDGSTVNLIDLV